MTLDQSKAKRPWLAPPVPDDFCTWIGKLAITWAMVEMLLDGLIVGLYRDTGIIPEKNWERLNFKKRKVLCKKLATISFSRNPTLLNELSLILGDAADLQWRRNFLLHGRIDSSLTVVGDDVSNFRIVGAISATSRHNGRDVTLPYGIDEIERLFLDIAHVCGRLDAFTSVDEHPVPLSSEDRSRLVEFLRSARQTDPNPNTPPAPPQSSPA